MKRTGTVCYTDTAYLYSHIMPCIVEIQRNIVKYHPPPPGISEKNKMKRARI
jgi:hypothetical protein